MTIPNAENAVVDVAKLTDYCLNRDHPRGRHKARVFAAALGLNVENAADLQAALLHAVSEEPATITIRDEFGQRYVVDFTMEGPAGTARVRSSWIIRTEEDFRRLTSCYVL